MWEYVVKDNVEALLSGAASVALGIISFHGERRESQLRRNTAEEDADKNTYVKVSQGIHRGRETTRS